VTVGTPATAWTPAIPRNSMDARRFKTMTDLCWDLPRSGGWAASADCLGGEGGVSAGEAHPACPDPLGDRLPFLHSSHARSEIVFFIAERQ
jgi:hypothetical protein